ncbi:hypothetical protein [Ectobacillus polymachus]|uniref:hypothetical protein n=1 Tax=Ectobacillus polymachus TaxID=1508806 RepID=UPI003A8969B2
MEVMQAEEILQSLRTGEIAEYVVEKEDFYSFRSVLVKQSDFKRFRGIAQRNAIVVYTYMEKERS